MNSPVHIDDKSGWFSRKGGSDDVVIASRVRLSRNLNGYLYPGKMGQKDEDAVSENVRKAFEAIDTEDSWSISEIGKLNPLDRKILLERNHLSQEFILHGNKSIVMSRDNLASCAVNDTDHLRMSFFEGGLSVGQCAGRADELDRQIEKHLDYAVSFEFGYLNTEVNNLGTGMRASVMMHLPALVKTNLIEKALKAVVQIGFTVKGFMGDEEHSLGSMYQISNQFTIGHSEAEIVEKLENLCIQIAEYERKARSEMFQKKKTEIEDSIFRAYGLLTNCRILTSNEAIANLSMLRMGISLGLIELPIEVCSSLIFLSQKSHIQKMIEDPDSRADEKLIDYTRADFIKNTIIQKKL